MRQLPGLDILAGAPDEQQMALAAVLEYLVIESLELANNLCDETEMKALDADVMGPHGWERVIQNSEEETDSAPPRPWAMASSVDQADSSSKAVIFTAHILLGLMRDEELGALLPKADRPPPKPESVDEDASDKRALTQHERAALARCWRLDPGLAAALTELMERLPLAELNALTEDELELGAIFMPEKEDLEPPQGRVNASEKQRLEMVYYGACKSWFVKHSRHLVALTGSHQVIAAFEEALVAAGLQLATGEAVQESGPATAAALELSALLHARGNTEHARRKLREYSAGAAASKTASSATALLYADIYACARARRRRCKVGFRCVLDAGHVGTRLTSRLGHRRGCVL